jgi:hypothetical protein
MIDYDERARIEAANKERLHELARLVAHELGAECLEQLTPGHDRERGQRWLRLERDRPELCISVNHNKPSEPRAVIRWRYWPQDCNGSEIMPRNVATYINGQQEDWPSLEITAAMTKSPAAIVRDIRRRLIEPLAPWVVRCEERAQQSREHGDETERSAQRLAALIGADPKGPRHLSDRNSRTLYAGGWPFYSLRITGDRVEVERLTLTVDNLAQLIESGGISRRDEQ